MSLPVLGPLAAAAFGVTGAAAFALAAGFATAGAAAGFGAVLCGTTGSETTSGGPAREIMKKKSPPATAARPRAITSTRGLTWADEVTSCVSAPAGALLTRGNLPRSRGRGPVAPARYRTSHRFTHPSRRYSHVILDRISSRIRRGSSEGGFTLIELLVVIIIIGILLAIAVPSYLSFRDRANKSAAQANVRAAVPAMEAYFADNNTYSGATLAGLQASYDQGIKGVAIDAAQTNDSQYCVYTSPAVGGHVYYKLGPGGDILPDSTPTGTPCA